ncbi:MAG: hypothetical protein AAGA11_15360 [Pseudomonadota bacterium]
MKTLCRKVVTVCGLVGLAACDSTPLSESTDGGDATVARHCGPATGTGTGDPAASHRIAVDLRNVPAALPCEARVRITVYGYDRMVADVAATPLLSVVEPVPASATLVLHVDDSDFQRIAFQTGVTSTLGHYLDVDLDVDGDGTVCGADLSQDFSASPMVFFRYEDTSAAASVALRVNGDLCP